MQVFNSEDLQEVLDPQKQFFGEKYRKIRLEKRKVTFFCKEQQMSKISIISPKGKKIIPLLGNLCRTQDKCELSLFGPAGLKFNLRGLKDTT